MNESEWLTCNTMQDIWTFLYRKPYKTERKGRLHACACCRRVWDKFPDERSRQAIIVAQQHADGLATDAELEAAANTANLVWDAEEQASPDRYRWAEEPAPYPWSAAAYNVAIPQGWWGGAPAYVSPDQIIRDASPDPAAEEAAQCAIWRDLLGNPFRPVTADPSWRTSTAVALARQMYEARDFAAMPILADALQDAGCDHADVLEHCRGPGPHVRGCWVIDLMLGKS